MNLRLQSIFSQGRLICCAALLVAGALAVTLGSAGSTDPWTSAQTIQPAQLVPELLQIKDPHVLVIYVGVRTLYNGGDISGAGFFCPRFTHQGSAAVKKNASTLP